MMAGLLDSLDDPANSGLLGLGLRLMSTPGSFGRALGVAGQGALGDIQDARKQADARKMQAQQLAMQQQQMQHGALQMQMQQQQLQEAQRQQALHQQRQQAFQGAWANGTPGIGSPNGDVSGDFTAPGKPGTLDMQSYLQRLVANGDAEGAMPVFQSMQKDTKPIALADGGMLVSPDGRLIANNPKDNSEKLPEVTRLIQQRASLPQGSPLIPVYDAAIKKATTHQDPARMSVTNVGETEYDKNRGKDWAETMASMNKSGFTAPAQLRKLERMKQLLDGVDGGKLAPTGLDVASSLNSIGIKVDPRLGNKEAAEALARDMAGGLRQPGTGPMTDKDFDNFLTQIPSLSKSAAGRSQIMTTMQAALNRDIELSRRARAYEKKNGRLDGGFMDEAAQFIAETPVVGAPQGWKVQR